MFVKLIINVILKKPLVEEFHYALMNNTLLIKIGLMYFAGKVLLALEGQQLTSVLGAWGINRSWKNM